VALRIKGKGSVFHDVLVTGALSAALFEWKEIQESLKAKRIRAARQPHSGLFGPFCNAQSRSRGRFQTRCSLWVERRWTVFRFRS
jgi:hypothetical protein